jgi:ribosomal protein S18 acetylase RimI-like enzyme
LTAEDGILIVDVPGPERIKLDGILEESFEGWYLRHSRRTLVDAELVRAAMSSGTPVGLVMLKTLEADVGYVYYIAVSKAYRGRGVGSMLLEDALGYFVGAGMKEVYASVEADNEASEGLFKSKGFVKTSFGDVSKKYGSLHALAMYRKMVVVPGEILLLKDLTSAKA